MLIIADSTTFQTFHVVISSAVRTGELIEYLGTARRWQGQAQIALANIHAHASLRQQYSSTESVKCTSVWGGNTLQYGKCMNYNYQGILCRDSNICKYYYTPRGYTEYEVDRITQALRAAGYERIAATVYDDNVDIAMLAEQAEFALPYEPMLV